MGAMNAVFAPGHRLPVGLTYMTGAWMAFGRAAVSGDRGIRSNAGVYLAHWSALVVGGVLAGLMMRVWGIHAFVIALIGAAMLWRFAPEEEGVA